VATCIVRSSLLLSFHPVPYCLGADNQGLTGRRGQCTERTAAPTGAGPDAGGAEEQNCRSAYKSGHSAEHAAVGQTSYDHCVAELTALIWSKLPQTAGRRLKVSVKRSGIVSSDLKGQMITIKNSSNAAIRAQICYPYCGFYKVGQLQIFKSPFSYQVLIAKFVSADRQVRAFPQ
jgi:hypothetical protein